MPYRQPLPLSLLLTAAALGSSAVVVAAPAPPESVIDRQREQTDALARRPWQSETKATANFIAQAQDRAR